MIAIIDYGAGNLHSVYNALQKIGCDCKITKEKEDLQKADGIILPGVGAFYDSMQNLVASGVIPTLQEEIQKGKPLLGICLGMQMLFERGFEVQPCDGLGLLKGDIVLMEDATLKIPHMGWNQLQFAKQDSIMQVFKKEPFVYFVHSFYAQNYQEEDLVAYAKYGAFTIPAYVRNNNVMGMQYHPEKSGEEGLLMLSQFVSLCSTQ